MAKHYPKPSACANREDHPSDLSIARMNPSLANKLFHTIPKLGVDDFSIFFCAGYRGRGLAAHHFSRQGDGILSGASHPRKAGHPAHRSIARRLACPGAGTIDSKEKLN
jgi:hypothetical protein